LFLLKVAVALESLAVFCNFDFVVNGNFFKSPLQVSLC
jgi:hypothetical protein